MKVLITHKGIIFDERALIALTTPGAVRALKQKLTVKYQPQVRNKIIPAKFRYLYKNINVGSRTLLVVSRHSDAEKIIFNYLLTLKDTGGSHADTFITGLEYVNKVMPGDSFPDGVDLTPGINPMPHQKRIIDYLFAHVYNDVQRARGAAGCVIVAGTGEGKSYISAYIAAHLGGKTAIIIPNTLQLEEWQHIFGTYYPNLRIGEYHSKAKRDGDVVLIVKDSAVSDVFKFSGRAGRAGHTESVPWQTYVQRFRTVIYDEIHNYPTIAYQEMFWRFGCANTIGLTATPDERADAFDSVYVNHVGPLIYPRDIADAEMEDAPESAEEAPWRGRVRVIHYYGHPDHTKKISVSSDGTTHAGLMAKQFSEDPQRNKLIFALIRELYEAGRNIFIFAENKEYVTRLREQLTASGNMDDIPVETPQITIGTEEVSTLKGGVSGEDKAQASTQARIIMITYAFGSEQLSIPRMDAIIFATSRKSKMNQIIGRITRRGGDKSIERIVIDIVDKETSIANQFGARRAVYREKNFIIGAPEVRRYTEFM
jgi:superfamily II DNA or RNA helicase